MPVQLARAGAATSCSISLLAMASLTLGRLRFGIVRENQGSVTIAKTPVHQHDHDLDTQHQGRVAVEPLGERDGTGIPRRPARPLDQAPDGLTR